MAYDRTNTGIISKNDRKTEDKHPDIKGTINIEGREYDLAGWKKERNDGSGSFYSLKASVPRNKPQQQTTSFDDGDAIPF